jgi:hypothetical protein
MTSPSIDTSNLAEPTALNGANPLNPAFDFLTGFVPRKLKDLFKWAEYLAFNSAHIYGVVRKFREYPITSFIYDTTSPDEKQRHQDLFEKKTRLKGFLPRYLSTSGFTATPSSAYLSRSSAGSGAPSAGRRKTLKSPITSTSTRRQRSN